MKIIDLLNDDEQAACRQKAAQKVQTFIEKELCNNQSDEERFATLHAYFKIVADKTDHFAENFDKTKFKRRGNHKEDMSFLKTLAKGNLEGVQMLDDICDEMLRITMSPETGMTKTFKECSMGLGMYRQKLAGGDNVLTFPKAKVGPVQPNAANQPSYDMVIGK